jgi:hypothetical protein
MHDIDDIARPRVLLTRDYFMRDTIMKRISASTILFLATIAPAVAAETTERNDSLPDSNPECMQVNGPDCVLKSQVVLPRMAAPPVTAVPPGAVVVPAPTPSGTVAPRGTVAPQGGVVVPATAPSGTTAQESTNVILPQANRPTIISPH